MGTSEHGLSSGSSITQHQYHARSLNSAQRMS